MFKTQSADTQDACRRRKPSKVSLDMMIFMLCKFGSCIFGRLLVIRLFSAEIFMLCSEFESSLKSNCLKPHRSPNLEILLWKAFFHFYTAVLDFKILKMYRHQDWTFPASTFGAFPSSNLWQPFWSCGSRHCSLDMPFECALRGIMWFLFTAMIASLTQVS